MSEQMDTGELRRIEAVFHAVIDIPGGAEREAAARRESGNDPEITRRALALADSDDQARAANDAAQSAACEPRLYGNYRTIRLLGSGGMGAVYLAERADGQFRHTVALKMIAPHVAGTAFRERFLAERQILAGLNHPNITKLLEGGVTREGTPYLVMEYVDGEPLDRYCDARRKDLRARLELFLKVCAPVAYAHRNLVVHRDLKPSNILVTADGEPMLLDFGTAKLLAGADTNADTGLPLATPRYTSPEQWVHAPVTTSCDVFSLGVILYELLTGRWPFGDASSPQQMLERFARETPMTPPRALSGDLCNVMGKALATAPERRYESVQALADDVRNWLNGLPVSAKATTFRYRAAKFLRRHWLPSAAGVVFAAGLMASALFAAHEATLARAEALRAEKVSGFLNDTLASASVLDFDPRKFTVAQMLDAAAPRLDRSWKGDPAIEATLRNSLGSSYTAVQKYDSAKAQLEQALATFRRLGRTSDEASSLFLLGLNAADAGEAPASVRYYHAALERLGKLGTKAPPLLVFHTKAALADELSAVMNQNIDEAARLFKEAMDLAAREPSIPRPDVAIADTDQGGMWMNLGRTAEAEAAFHRSIEIYCQLHYKGAATGQPFYDLAILNSRRDNFTAARDFSRQFYEETVSNIGPDHLRTALAKLMWARFRAETGETREAVAQTLEALPIARRSVPPLASTLWTPLINASRVMNLAGRFSEAEPLAREQLAIVDYQKIAETDSRRAGSLVELGNALRGEKKYREATLTYDRARKIYEQLGPVWANRARQVNQLIRDGTLSSASQ